MDAPLSDYVRGQWPALVRYGTLLTGNAGDGEELVQAALVRVALRWPFVRDKDDPDGYVRRAILRGFLNDRTRIRSRETSTEAVPEVLVGDPSARVDDLVTVRRALATLPARQRAVLVLRYLDDLSEQQAAEALGCSIGTVKSQSSKGLAKLRELFADDASPSVRVRRSAPEGGAG